MRLSLMAGGGVLLLAAAGFAEQAVRRDQAGKASAPEATPQPEAERRHPSPREAGEPTAVPKSDAAREPTREPEPTPTPQPAPTPTPEAESPPGRRHPRPQERAPHVETPSPAPPSPERRSLPRVSGRHRPQRQDEAHPRDDRPRARAWRGHLGPHYHQRQFVPESCGHDVVHVHEVEPRSQSDPMHPNYDGMAALRLLVDPPETRIDVDGYYAGAAEDFDGLFQRLHVPEGCHDVALVLAGHRTHRFRVYATTSRVLKLRHDMRRGEGSDGVDVAEGLCRSQRTPPPAPSARDFELDRQHWFLAHGRLTTVVGLVRGELGGERRGAQGSPIVVRVEARSEGGAVIATERESRLEIDADGSFLTSYRLDLAPGTYSLHLAVRETASARMSVVNGSLEVPDLHATDISVPLVLILESMRAAPADGRHPLGALVLDRALPVPRFGNRFRPTDAPMLLFQFARPASPSAVYASYVILGPDDRMVAHDGRLQDEQVAVSGGRAVGASAFGPIPFDAYRPGRYRVLVTVTDVASRATSAQEGWFHVDPADRTALSWSGDNRRAPAAAAKP